MEMEEFLSIDAPGHVIELSGGEPLQEEVGSGQVLILADPPAFPSTRPLS